MADAHLHRRRAAARWLYVLAAAATICLGLASRRWPWLLPEPLGKYPGDALYALLIYLLVCLLRPGLTIAATAMVALLWCFGVEFLQLWQPPWLQAVRATTAGHLVLGSHFHALDLLAYGVGVWAAGGVEWVAWRRRWAAPYHGG
jgi:hypothetical protein